MVVMSGVLLKEKKACQWKGVQQAVTANPGVSSAFVASIMKNIRAWEWKEKAYQA
jgi:hypothetical protein